MNIFYLLNGILFLGLFLFLIIKLFKTYGNRDVYRIMKLFSVSSIGCFVISLISFLWFFNFLGYSQSDFIIMFGGFLLILALVFFRAIYLFTNNKRLNYFLAFYCLSIIVLIFVGFNTALFVILSSLFILLIFMEFLIRGDIYRKVGYLGVLFSVVSLISGLLLFLGLDPILFLVFLNGLSLFWLFFVFLFDLNKYSILPASYDHERGYFFVLFGHLIFVIAFVNFIFIGTVGIHEFGHYSVSQFFDCQDGKIVYESSLFHTETLCGSERSVFYVTIGGVLFPLIVAGVLFLFRGKFFREVALMIIGFDLASISMDLRMISVSENFVVLSLILGILFVILGVFLIARGRIDDSIYEGNVIGESVNQFKNKEGIGE